MKRLHEVDQKLEHSTRIKFIKFRIPELEKVSALSVVGLWAAFLEEQKGNDVAIPGLGPDSVDVFREWLGT